jgi:hypothetical protein
MIIDSHAHVMLPTEKQIALMKEASVDKAILFSTLVHPEKAQTRSAFETEMAMLGKILRGEINPSEARIVSLRELQEVIAGHKELFLGFGACPAGLDYESTCQWIDQYVVKAGMKGIGEIALGPGMVEKTQNIFKAVSGYKTKCPLWFHTFNPLTSNDIEAIVDLAKMFPSVYVILGHGGGSHWLETIPLIKDLKNVFMDISASFTTFSLALMASEFPEKVLFSSDMPYGNPYLARQMVEYIVKDKSIQKMILGENILRLIEN